MQPSRELTAARDEFVRQLNVAMEKRKQQAAPESENDDSALNLSLCERAVLEYQKNTVLHDEAKVFFDNKRAEILQLKAELPEIKARIAEIDTEIKQSKSLLTSFNDTGLEKAQDNLVKAAKSEKESLEKSESEKLKKIKNCEDALKVITCTKKRVTLSDMHWLLNKKDFIHAVLLEREDIFKQAIDIDPVKSYLSAMLVHASESGKSKYQPSGRFSYMDVCQKLGDMIFSTLFDLPASSTGNFRAELSSLINAEREKISDLLKSEVSKLDSEMELQKAA